MAGDKILFIPGTDIIGTAVISPADYTLLARLKAIEGYTDGLEGGIGAIADALVNAGAEGSLSAKLRRLTTDLDALNTIIGAVTESPTTYTLLERLKVIDTSTQSLLTTLGLVAAGPVENTIQERLLALENAIAALPQAPPAMHKSSQQTGTVFSGGNGKLYYVVWSSYAGGTPHFKLDDDDGTFFDMYAPVSTAGWLSPAKPISCKGKCEITTSDSIRPMAFGWTLDSEE